MSSELWQRLRAARKYSDKRQQDIASVSGVSRGAVAQWESEDPNNRTRPDIDQIQKIARETGVPVEWLLNDSANTEDVWKVGQLNGVPRAVSRGHEVQPAVGENRLVNTFIKAVEFAILEQDPARANCFDAHIGNGPAPFHIDFACGKHLVSFALGAADPGTLAHLLLVERAAGRPMNKHVVIWRRRGDLPIDNHDDVAHYCLATFGIKVEVVDSPVSAADYLLSLA